MAESIKLLKKDFASDPSTSKFKFFEYGEEKTGFALFYKGSYYVYKNQCQHLPVGATRRRPPEQWQRYRTVTGAGLNRHGLQAVRLVRLPHIGTGSISFAGLSKLHKPDGHDDTRFC